MKVRKEDPKKKKAVKANRIAGARKSAAIQGGKAKRLASDIKKDKKYVSERNAFYKKNPFTIPSVQEMKNMSESDAIGLIKKIDNVYYEAVGAESSPINVGTSVKDLDKAKGILKTRVRSAG